MIAVPLINKIINSNPCYHHLTWNFLKNLFFLAFLRSFFERSHFSHPSSFMRISLSKIEMFPLEQCWNNYVEFFLPAVSTAVSNQRPSFYINYKQLFRNICDDAFCWSVIFDKCSKVFLQKVDKKQLLIGKSDNYVENSVKPWPKTLKKDNTTTIKQWL